VSEIRVRFPPSPTGYLHIGSARTALFNWLYARKHGGTLVFRIEDTDAERSTEESERGIFNGLEWLGIDWDEGPYRQTEHAADHRAEAERLLAEGKAYRCFCTKDTLDAKRKAAEQQKTQYGYDRTCRDIPAAESERRAAAGEEHVVRFKVPDSSEPVAFEDEVFGRIETGRKEIDDFVIVRSNGVPLYVLSNVVDDHRDRITHVIRGADHLPNTTPRQVLLYQALGFEAPIFAHMSLTLDPKKAKISKRKHGAMATVGWYRENGFLPMGFVNFLALLGWNPGEDREYFESREAMIEAFELEGLTRANAVFNYRKGDPKFDTDPKAIHINSLHLRAMPLDELLPYVRQELTRAGLWRDEFEGERAQWFCDTVELLRGRYTRTTDFATLGRPYFSDDFEFEDKALNKGLRKDPALKQHLPVLADRFEALQPFDAEQVEACIRGLAEELGVKVGLLTNATRAAVTGQNVGPSLFELVVHMGQQTTIERMRKAVDRI